MAEKNNIGLDLGRCVCIHTQLQVVDLVLQSVLLRHSLIPSPLVMMDPSCKQSARTIGNIQNVREELRAVFRTRYRSCLRELLFVVGQTPLRPLHTYRVPISLCYAEDSHAQACGSPCAELSDSEKRRLNLSLFRRLPFESAKNVGLRMFVFLKGTDALVSENVEEYDSDMTHHVEKSRIVHLSHSNCHTEPFDDDASGLVWMRLVPHIMQAK